LTPSDFFWRFFAKSFHTFFIGVWKAALYYMWQLTMEILILSR